MNPARREFLRTLAKGSAVGATVAAVSAIDRPFRPFAPLLAAPASARYSTSTDPFAMDRRLKAISSAVPSGTAQAKVSWIFNRLNRYASGGVKVHSMTGKPPRTAAEALAKGGDCTDLTNIVVSLFKQHNIPGGVMLVHFDSAPAYLDHVVPYALLGGKKIIVDLQTNTLGKTAQGAYKKLMDLSYAEGAGMYHREMGDFFKQKGDSKVAFSAYKRSVELNDKDPHVHQNLGILYQKANDHANALKHIRRAAALDPAYKKHLPGAIFNSGLQEGQKAYGEGRFADCARHFEMALDSGHPIPASYRKALQGNIQLCKSKAAGN
ncbi:MAG: tetratricopeptide repeat protein [Candidatus Micrarchaeota archaeon]